jgi:hypothetical protein
MVQVCNRNEYCSIAELEMDVRMRQAEEAVWEAILGLRDVVSYE